VICCRGNADEAMTTMRAMMGKLRLTVNEKKTRRCPLAGGYVYVSWVHVRVALLEAYGPGLHRPGPATKKVL